MIEPIEFRSGHRFEHNGVGDYDLICPEHGKRQGFIPYMIAHTCTSDDRCPSCNKLFGARVHTVEIAESTNASDDVTGKRKVTAFVNDSAGAVEPKL